MVEDAPTGVPQALDALAAGGAGRGRRWSGRELAAALDVSEGSLSAYRRGKAPIPQDRLRALKALFFRTEQDRNAFAAEYRVFQLALGEISARNDILLPVYSALDVWKLMLRPLEANVERLVVEPGDVDGRPYLTEEHLSSAPVTREFFLPVPEWFAEWASRPEADGLPRYEINTPVDLAGDPALGDFIARCGVPDVMTIIRNEGDAYARSVRAAYENRFETHPPYNKRKIGLQSWRQPVPRLADERAHLSIGGFVTDYFTHRVMRRVMATARARHPRAFALTDGSAAMAAGLDLAYYTTSIGINVVVITTRGERRLHMVRTSARHGNANQRGRLHITANEGLNDQDLDSITRQIDFSGFLKRALTEELGVRPSDPAAAAMQVSFLEFSIEMTNFEPFISCVVELPLTAAGLREALRSHARDGRREIAELVDIPATASAVIGLLVDHPEGTGGFTSFSLNILDLVIEKGLVT
ncbi:MAG: hypothetical protein CMO30_20955 [Tistrella sp.]|uniref:Uncharacterized protein n=1 Tax=Tistrella mobilis TaxID=171437 RepID=A0A3B9IFD5_9PROT|nr:hypothetical protein [Tistrella sp.]MAD36311.1 hypothetical protein [Tistrella sp.]MBA77746.1 hypothetical protein [Tistrella sp.]HAE46552.1 hypothetical protein [Tistrella mobilis]